MDSQSRHRMSPISSPEEVPLLDQGKFNQIDTSDVSMVAVFEAAAEAEVHPNVVAQQDQDCEGSHDSILHIASAHREDQRKHPAEMKGTD